MSNVDRQRRRAAASVAETLRVADVHRVLVVATHEGHGVRMLSGALVDPLSDVFGHAIAWSHAPDLDGEPPENGDRGVHLVCGPPYTQGDALVRASLAWRTWFDGALVVVSNRRTERADLRALAAWLRAVDIPPVGVLYNDYGCLTFADRYRRRAAQVRRWFARRANTRTAPRADAGLREQLT